MSDDDDEPRIKLKDMAPVERRRILKRMADHLTERAKKRISLGWQCPACQRVYGPRARECWVCNSRK